MFDCLKKELEGPNIASPSEGKLKFTARAGMNRTHYQDLQDHRRLRDGVGRGLNKPV